MKSVVLVVALSIAAPAGATEPLKIEPGQWEFDAVSKMMGQTRPHHSSECVEEPEMAAERFLAEMQAECSVTNLKSSATAMSWDVTCRTGDGEMRGSSKFTSTGSTVDGSMTIAMNVNGRKLTMDYTWAGKRVGPCK